MSSDLVTVTTTSHNRVYVFQSPKASLRDHIMLEGTSNPDFSGQKRRLTLIEKVAIEKLLSFRTRSRCDVDAISANKLVLGPPLTT